MDLKELRVSDKIDSKQNHPWEFARSKVVISIIKKYIQSANNGIVVDVGCGDVFFLTRFADRYPDFDLIAVDIAFDQEIISKLKSKYKKYNIAFYNNIHSVTNINKASVVFLLDVIEHIEDDIAFLKDLSSQEYINSDTVFVITVPAFNELYCNRDAWLGHFRRYSHRFLKEQIEMAGLTYIEGGYFFTSPLLPRYIQKIYEKFMPNQKDHNQGIGNYRGGAVLSFIYEKFLLMDFYFFRIFKFLKIKIPGISTYVICK